MSQDAPSKDGKHQPDLKVKVVSPWRLHAAKGRDASAETGEQNFNSEL
jgi:hypothetical protein